MKIIDGVAYGTYSVERLNPDTQRWELTTCQGTGCLDCQQWIDDQPTSERFCVSRDDDEILTL